MICGQSSWPVIVTVIAALLFFSPLFVSLFAFIDQDRKLGEPWVWRMILTIAVFLFIGALGGGMAVISMCDPQ